MAANLQAVNVFWPVITMTSNKTTNTRFLDFFFVTSVVVFGKSVLVSRSLKANRLRDAPTGLTFNNCSLCPHCIYVFCIYLRTNSDLCHLQHKLIGFYNRDGKCLQRGTDRVFKYTSLGFVCKRVNVL